MGYPQPLHGVQGVVEKVGVQLGLEHPQAGPVQLPLPLDRPVQVQPVLRRHPVEPAGQAAQLVGPVRLQAHVQTAPLHLAHGLVQLVDRPGEGAAEDPGAPHAQKKAHRPHHGPHQVEAAQHQGGEGPGTLEDEDKACVRPLGGEEGVLPGHAGQGAPREELLPQALHCGAPLGGLGAVDRPPPPVQQQHLAGRTVQAVEHPVKALLLHLGGHISQNIAAAAAHRLGGDEPAVLSGPEGQTLLLTGVPQDAPARVPLPRRRGAGGGVAAHALPVIDVKAGIGPQGLGGAKEHLVEGPGVLAAPAQGGADHRAVRQRAGDVPAGVPEIVQSRAQGRQLGVGLLGQALLAPDYL